MNKRKYLAVPIIYGFSVCLLIGCILFVIGGLGNYLKEVPNYNYGINDVFDKTLPVMKENGDVIIVKPYISSEVSVGKYFYDFEGEKENQENSIIYYENTYMQNSGVDYISDSTFEVISILDGDVISVTEDKTLGNIVQVKHDKELISIYQGLENVNVKEGDKVSQNQVIGYSGVSKINPEYKSMLHFEVYYKGEIMDPENLYFLNIKDF